MAYNQDLQFIQAFFAHLVGFRAQAIVHLFLISPN